MSTIFTKSKWIWRSGALEKPEFTVFYKKVTFDKKPRKLIARIACSTRYFFNISNGKKGNFVAWNGGISDSVADYYDEIDITKYCKKGENAFVFVCEYVPLENGGKMNASPAFIFEATMGDEVKLGSDASFECAHLNWIEPELRDKATSANSFWKYDATTQKTTEGLFSVNFASNMLAPAEEKGDYDENDLPLKKRPVPMFVFGKPVKAKATKTSTLDKNIYTVKFDAHKRVYPSFVLQSERGKEEVVFYGDYPELAQKYICNMNQSSFDFPFLSVTGDKLVIETPKSVKLKKASYRAVGYGETLQVNFKSDDEVLNSIFKKSASTLYACISDRFVSAYPKASCDFYDCIVAARDLMIGYKEGGVALVRKMINDVLSVSEKYGCLMEDPLGDPKENPLSGLLCISEFGFFAAYTDAYTDLDREIYDCVIKYLSRWQLSPEGLLVPRVESHNETDNFDETVSENTLYYSALKYAKELAGRLKETDTEFIDNTSEILRNAIISSFFNGKIFSSGKVCDDRANAFAVLAGLWNEENKDSIATFLASAQNASIYTECYIIEALCKLGRHRLASLRLKNRYYAISRFYSSSMPENFMLDGEQCCLHSAMPLYTLLSCFGGVKVSGGGKAVTLTPGLADLGYMDFTAMTPAGKIKGSYSRSEDKNVIIIDNDTKLDASVVLYNASGNMTRNIKLMKGKNKIIMED